MNNLADMNSKPVNTEDYYLLKEEQDIFNKETSLKDIETELLRLDQYHFNIEFNNYKGPNYGGEMTMIKDTTKKLVKVDKDII